MKRKYGYIKEHEKEMLEMKAKGISIRKIGECFGLTYEQTHDFYKRHNRKQRRIENGEGLKKKGRPSKDDKYSSDTNNVNELKYIIARKDSKIKALEMEVELMRDFLSLTERK